MTGVPLYFLAKSITRIALGLKPHRDEADSKESGKP